MHESIAKAQVKGKMRVANDVLDKYNEKVQQQAGQHVKLTRKKAIAYVQNIFDMYGDLLLFHKIDKRKSSWHFNSLNIAVNPDSVDFREIGVLHCIICERVVTRKIRSGKQPYHHYSSRCFVHVHFLQRLLQRISPLQQSAIKKELVNIVLWISSNDVSNIDQSKKFHFVSKDKVFVVTFHTEKSMYIFNTVLLKEQFSSSQCQSYEKAYLMLDEQDINCVFRTSDGGMHLGIKERNTVNDEDITRNNVFFNLDFGEENVA